MNRQAEKAEKAQETKERQTLMVANKKVLSEALELIVSVARLAPVRWDDHVTVTRAAGELAKFITEKGEDEGTSNGRSAGGQ